MWNGPNYQQSLTLDNVNIKIFSADGLVKVYGSRRVVEGLNFSVNNGEIVGLLGPNGAGKTTAFYMAMGLVAPSAGRVFFQGQDVTHLAVHQRARLGMGYLAQEPSVFRQLTVEQNILCILEGQGLRRKERKVRLEELLQELNLSSLAKSRAGSLSGGERRRLEITRSLVTKPSFLLLDEPFANVDPLTIQDLKQMIQMLSSKGISVLITDHNAREIFSVVDRSYLVQKGHVVAEGSPQELISNPMVRETYLGKDFRL